MKILTIVGARPQFIKAATISRAISERDEVQEVIVHTGQHYDVNMSDIFFEEMSIPKPHYRLDINGVGHGAMTGRMLEEIEKIILKEKPDWVLVYGDTNSTLAGALAASKLHVKVAHIEAGLRSFNMRMPEEQNRILTDRISSVLFCPTETAIKNLATEGYLNLGIKIFNSGDVMYDAALFYSKKADEKKLELDLPSTFILSTCHRAENTDNIERLEEIIKALNFIHLKMPVIMPIHPRTRAIIQKNGIKVNFKLIDPVSYFEMITLLKKCSYVMTDSGGLQKEAYFFKKPCLTMRDETEWVELVNSGANKLVGASAIKIQEAFDSFEKESFDFSENLYGDGNASHFIVEKLISYK